MHGLRQVCQTYIYWYTGFFAFNATALSFVVTRAQPNKLWPVCAVFIVFNVLGIGSSTVIATYGRDVHDSLEKSHEFFSPIPISLWTRVTGICRLSLVAMALIWIVVMAR
jgi:hypothetical protein